MIFLAHSSDSGSNRPGHLLKSHLWGTAELASKFSASYMPPDIVKISALLHDLGKYSLDFQKKLSGVEIKVDHSSAGALIANKKYKLGKIIAYCICGHHGGLPDGFDSGFDSKKSSLEKRLKNEAALDEVDLAAFFDDITLPETIDTKIFSKTNYFGVSIFFYIKMIFSALVDADYLDTEKYYYPERVSDRSGWQSLNVISEIFFNNLANLQTAASNTIINAYRKEIYVNCIEASQNLKGIFTLSVPTGGGKTLSSMAFALKHAKKHNMHRIIYAIPFTSIIEQTADVFRKMTSDNAILEHHSNFSFDDNDNSLSKLSSENWDAPIIITTNVQFFESLFSHKPSKCRKLHNISNSIIIFDEVQTIPDDLLKPCLASIECLVRDYGSTVVLCTATQPAWKNQWLDQVVSHEIIKDPKRLYTAFKKVNIVNLGKQSNEDIANRLYVHDQVLCIVNTRRHAKTLFSLLPNKEDCYFHLSALMCPKHRSEILDEIKKRLSRGLRCVVISTQLIEAGVDIDFPVVYRSAAGIDSIAQAAGRCNREGLQKTGTTYVFQPEEGLPKGWFQRMAAIGEEIINLGIDPLSETAVEMFFNQRYIDSGINGLDKHEIIRLIENGKHKFDFPFEHISTIFRFIESTGTSLIVPFDGKCKDIINSIEHSENPWKYSRELSKYTVTVYPHEFAQLVSLSYIKLLKDAFYILSTDEQSFKNIYSLKSGLNVEPEREVLIQ